MMRQSVSFATIACLMVAVPAPDAGAVELPVRKAGLWEMRTMQAGSATPEMTMQQCTDATTDKEMSTSFSPASQEMCSKQDIQKTATGYVTDSVCSVAGMSITSHSEITGDFNSAYTVKSTSNTKGGPAGMARDSTTVIEAKWLGACKSGQKPGDIVMPGGIKMNIKDMEKLKGMMPKQLPR
ncbi:DUF3617 family protein [Bradyrhizobium sp.]|uniref:DUF3617 domain-containing protein n=1 Tax=Bradyrhizobium sp. TaxID=376 RepID=UPI000B327C3F|nr:DUF3617 family protein [Bradyrhizobium sp.]